MYAFGMYFGMYPVPAVKGSKGGLCTMWKKGLTKNVSKINRNNYRVQATRFQVPFANLLTIDSYFMYDPQTDFDDSGLYVCW